VATAAEEVKNPQRDLPIGIIGSLLICTVLYIIVSAILTGVLPYTDYKNIAAPVAFALLKLGIPWGSALVAVGAVAGITSVCLVTTYGATRIIYSLSRDGLLPKTFSEVNKKYGTPGKTTILVGCIAIVLAGFGILNPVTAAGTQFRVCIRCCELRLADGIQGSGDNAG
jgi:APA family basic amino acid/polyamine antiporter